MKMRDWGKAVLEETDSGSSRLRDDLRTLASDMDHLLRATASSTGDQIAAARARAQDSLKSARACIADAQESAIAKTRAAGRATDDYVRENPWQVLAMAAVAALAVGYLMARASDD